MRKVQVTPRRRLLIHGVLVLLPLVLLTALAVSWLRQDQYAVKESTKELGGLLAQETSRRIADGLAVLPDTTAASRLASHTEFTVLPEGQLLSPSPREAVPRPQPLPLEELRLPEQMLWIRAVEADQNPEAAGVRSNLWWAFLQSSAPDEWLSYGRYHQAQNIAEKNPAEASRLLSEIVNRGTMRRLESGLPLLPLAHWRWLELNTNLITAEIVERFCSNVVRQASFLTPDLLQRAGKLPGPRGASANVTGKWLAEWERQERARGLYALGAEVWQHAGVTNSTPHFHWLEKDGDWWLAVLQPASGKVGAVSWSDLQNLVQARLKEASARSASLVFQVKLGGRIITDPFATGEITHRHQTTVPPEAEQLVVSKAGEGSQAVEVTAFLWQNNHYWAEQKRRLWWFGGVITLAVGAALVGLISAWRTFQQQWQLSEMKSNFVSSVSHELRAPLASVRLMAESLQRGKVAEPQRQHEYFDLIGRECRRLSSLVENVLDFARMDQGRKQYQMEPTDLVALVRHTVKSMEAYATERQVGLELTVRGEPADMEIDGQAMQQALVNLIDNAVKYSPKQKAVGIWLEFAEGQVVLAVRDEGPGIPPEEHERIFERFYRRGPELRRETQGVGIGLSIVKHVVEAHGGRVVVESAEGQGSCFRIEIPRK